jgi:hypothetical protein
VYLLRASEPSEGLKALRVEGAPTAMENKRYKGKVYSVFSQTPRHEDVWGSGNIAPFLTSAIDRYEFHVPATLPPVFIG